MYSRSDDRGIVGVVTLDNVSSINLPTNLSNVPTPHMQKISL